MDSRICETKDGKFIAMQTGGLVDRLPRSEFETDELYEQYQQECDAIEDSRLDTLKQIALNAGHDEDDIVVRFAHASEASALAKAAQTTYRELRAREYPPMADYLDGIVKGDDAQVQKYIEDCRTVKAKYPKS